MKLFIFIFSLSLFSFSQSYTLVDERKILDELDSILGNKTFQEANGQCQGKVSIQTLNEGKQSIKFIKVKKCNESSVQFTTRNKGKVKRLKSEFTKKEYDLINGNIIRNILNNFNVKTTINDQQTPNRLIIKNYFPVQYSLEDQTVIEAIELNASLEQGVLGLFTSSSSMKIIVATNSDLPFFSQALQVSIDGTSLIKVLNYTR